MQSSTFSERPGAYVRANGLDIYYQEYGSGQSLLLLHGGFSNSDMWKPHFPLFAEHFRVIAPDTRGHGRTKNPLDTMDYRLMADDVAALIKALGLEKPLLCGFSDGGQVALELGMNYPGLIKASVADGVSYVWTEEFLQLAKSGGIEAPGRVDFERFAREVPFLLKMIQEYQDAYQGDGYWKSYLTQISSTLLISPDYTQEALQRIGEPVLIMMGDRDVYSVEEALYLYRAIPHAELAIAPDPQHSYVTEKVELFMTLALDFLLRHRDERA